MAEYYLISQLPSLDGISENMPLPITEQDFLKMCATSLKKKSYDELLKLSLTPPRQSEKTSFSLAEAWNKGERSLRLALAVERAEKMKKEFDVEKQAFSPEILSAATLSLIHI